LIGPASPFASPISTRPVSTGANVEEKGPIQSEEEEGQLPSISSSLILVLLLSWHLSP
ncbi:unnamed protein product, partial [Musa acuminata var. zebrina]